MSSSIRNLIFTYSFGFFMRIWLNRYMTYLKELGLKIESYAKKAGFSQKTLGQFCDISQTQISRIFNGAGDTTTEKLKAICYGLNVSPEDLLFSEEENARFLYRSARNSTEECLPVMQSSLHGTHETIKMLSDLNYKLASDGGKLDTDELMAVEALLRTCLKSLHKEVKNDTTTESAKTA